MIGYLCYFKVILVTRLQYKVAAAAGIVTQFFWGFLQIFIYEAFYTAQVVDTPISYKSLVVYVWIQQSLLALITIRNKDAEFVQDVKNGNVAYEFLRPYNMYTWWYVKCIAKRVAAAALRCVPIIIVAILLPAPYNLTGPESVASFLLFLTTLFLGIFVLNGILILIQIITLFTYDDKGINSIINTVAELLAGLVLPIPLLPQIIQKVTYFLPFRLIGDLPFRIYSGNIPVKEAITSIGLQAFWIVALILIGKMILKSATKKMYMQGG